MTAAFVSVVIPVRNEAENLTALYCRLVSALESCGTGFELVIVDDGSTDSSWRILSDLHRTDRRVKGIRLSRNFGHQAAITAGLDAASGDAVITMDGDLQHPPELVPELIRLWRDGHPVVHTLRDGTARAGLLKRGTSALFYTLMEKFAGVPLRRNSADFRLIDRSVLGHLNRMRERSRFVRGMVAWLGFPCAEVHYTAPARTAGETRFFFVNMISLALDAVSSFSMAPLMMGFYAGLAINAICGVLAVYAIYNRYFEKKDLTEWASTFMVILFLGGMQMIMLGIIGVYLGRVYEEVKRRPLYVRQEVFGLDEAADRQCG
jgi:glycosyltransferase involved in cell wall biosynthesis